MERSSLGWVSLRESMERNKVRYGYCSWRGKLGAVGKAEKDSAFTAKVRRARTTPSACRGLVRVFLYPPSTSATDASESQALSDRLGARYFSLSAPKLTSLRFSYVLTLQRLHFPPFHFAPRALTVPSGPIRDTTPSSQHDDSELVE